MRRIVLGNKVVLITGAAGFIGSNLAVRLLEKIENITIVGIDNMIDYYDVSIKEYRLLQVQKLADSVSGIFKFIKADISDKETVQVLFSGYQPDLVVNLAGILMTVEPKAWSIWYMHLLPVFMEKARIFHIVFMKK